MGHLYGRKVLHLYDMSLLFTLHHTLVSKHSYSLKEKIDYVIFLSAIIQR